MSNALVVGSAVVAALQIGAAVLALNGLVLATTLLAGLGAAAAVLLAWLASRLGAADADADAAARLQDGVNALSHWAHGLLAGSLAPADPAASAPELAPLTEALDGLAAALVQAQRTARVLDALPFAVMQADPDDAFRITYMNEASLGQLNQIRGALPCPPEELFGRSIDVVHKDPGRVRALLSNPANLPHRAKIRLGDEVLHLWVAPLRDRDGRYLGPILSWQVITKQERLLEDLERDLKAEITSLGNNAEGLRKVLQATSADAEGAEKTVVAVVETTTVATNDTDGIAAAAEQLAASAREIGRQVEETSRLASGAAQQSEATNGRVSELSEVSRRIGDVVSLITDIAEQTNLLALNATIEAARAGEAGKGFSVVAAEVKNLANQTAKATEEVAAEIERLRGAVEAVVGDIGGVTKSIGDMSVIFGSVASAVTEQQAATDEISRNVRSAAGSSRSVNEGLGSVRQACHEASRATSGALATTVELGEAASRLNEAAQRFLSAARAA